MEKSWDVPVRELFLDQKQNPLYRATMSVNRFEDIRRVIRFDDRRTRASRAQTDKLAAFRYVWEMFIGNCQNVMTPNAYLTIDEQLLSFRGRCSFVQYMPKKPAKYGIKIFWLCDSKNSYAINGTIYTGRKPNEPVQKNLARGVVNDLAKIVEGSSRNITFDNFFCSVPLAEEMLQKGITVVGTLRHNKPDIPKEMLPSALREIKSSLFGFKGKVTMVSYVPKKKRAVILISTMHHDKAIDSNNMKNKPEIICFYNETKGGVDQMDQKVKNYTCKRQTRRWPFVLWMNVMDVAALNSQIIFSAQNLEFYPRRNDTRRLFLKDLSFELVRNLMERRANQPNLPKSLQHALSLCGIVRPEPTPETFRCVQQRRRCSFCPYERHRKSTMVCEKCNRSVCKEHSHIVCSSCL